MMADTRLILALFQPDIPQNAGTILRACACLGVGAAIVEPAGFPVSDRHFRRAGMDYLDHVDIARHVSFAAFEDWRRAAGRRLLLLTTQGATPYTAFAFRPDDVVMVGRAVTRGGSAASAGFRTMSCHRTASRSARCRIDAT